MDDFNDLDELEQIKKVLESKLSELKDYISNNNVKDMHDYGFQCGRINAMSDVISEIKTIFEREGE